MMWTDLMDETSSETVVQGRPGTRSGQPGEGVRHIVLPAGVACDHEVIGR